MNATAGKHGMNETGVDNPVRNAPAAASATSDIPRRVRVSDPSGSMEISDVLANHGRHGVGIAQGTVEQSGRDAESDLVQNSSWDTRYAI